MELSKSEQSKNNFLMNLNFHNINVESAIPVFAGALCSLLLCAVISVSFGIYEKTEIIEPVVDIIEEEDNGYSMLSTAQKIDDPVLKYFRDYEYKDWVTGFFAGICSNREIAQAVLENADKFDVPPALAFALSWEESRFNSQAVNRNNRDGSVDRGLFQLNNRSFPNLEVNVFFDIKTNSYYGLAHLRHCMDSGKNEVAALAMYNAGTGRVKNSGAPQITLNYISRILENQKKIESLFHTKMQKEEENRLAEIMLSENTLAKKNNNEAQFYFNLTLITDSPL